MRAELSPLFTRLGGACRAAWVALALLAGVHQAAAQGARFFRIDGPAATTITAFNPDGTLVWSNGLTGTNYTVQTVTSLPGGSNWVNYVQLPVTQAVNTNLLFAFNPPSGMALIPAGSFTMGDTLDGESDAIPTNIYVSAFYMDRNLVSYPAGTPYTSPVGYFAPNGYGLYDMAGDVAELCWDWYGTPYGQPTTNNPTGPASEDANLDGHVLRGGGWECSGYYARCASRGNYSDPVGYDDLNVGFRCVRGL